MRRIASATRRLVQIRARPVAGQEALWQGLSWYQATLATIPSSSPQGRMPSPAVAAPGHQQEQQQKGRSAAFERGSSGLVSWLLRGLTQISGSPLQMRIGQRAESFAQARGSAAEAAGGSARGSRRAGACSWLPGRPPWRHGIGTPGISSGRSTTERYRRRQGLWGVEPIGRLNSGRYVTGRFCKHRDRAQAPEGFVVVGLGC